MSSRWSSERVGKAPSGHNASATADVWYAVLIAGGIISASSSSAWAVDVTPQANQPSVARQPKKATVKTKVAEKRRPVTVVVVDEHGKPLANANVIVRRLKRGARTSHETRFTTSKAGRLTLSIPDPIFGSVDVYVQAPKHAGMCARLWDREIDGARYPPVPDTLTFRMQPGVRVGGKIVDDNGHPVPNASIRLSASRAFPGPSRSDWQSVRFKVKTGKDGTWKTPAQVPAIFSQATLWVEHPSFVDRGSYSLHQYVDRWRLLALTHTISLERGHPLEGCVSSPDGKPIAGAMVLRRAIRGPVAKATTDRRGYYRFPNASTGQNSLMVLVKHLAPELKQVDVSDELGTVNFQLKPGKTLRFRVLDPAGGPVEGVTVSPQSWRGEQFFFLFEKYKDSIPQKTGRDGRLVWKDAPPDEIQFNVIPPGSRLMQQLKQKFTARDKEYVIKLQPAINVSLRVVDAGTKKPIPRFKVSLGTKFADGQFFWTPFFDRDGQDGRLAFFDNSPSGKRAYRVHVKGYRSAVSREVKDGERKVALKFELTRAQGPTGTVIDAAGKPVSGARVYLCPQNGLLDHLWVDNGATVRGDIKKTTDAKGRFEFDTQDNPFVLLVTAGSGYAIISNGRLKRSPKITLRRWARVEGTLKIGAKPGANEVVALGFGDAFTTLDQPIYLNYLAIADKRGRFTFEKVPSLEPAEIGRQIVLSRGGPLKRNGLTHSKTIELKPGKTTRVTLGGTGRPVIGQLQLPAGAKNKADWNSFMNQSFIYKSVPFGAVPNPAMLFRNSPSYRFPVQPDGSFRVEDLPPGDYVLSARIYGPRVRGGRRLKRPELLGTLRHSFTIKPIPAGRSDTPLQLGTLKLK